MKITTVIIASVELELSIRSNRIELSVGHKYHIIYVLGYKDSDLIT